MKWVKILKENPQTKPRTCDDILFTNGEDVWAGWLETWEDHEDPSFYDCIGKSWPENVSHWAMWPLAPS